MATSSVSPAESSTAALSGTLFNRIFEGTARAATSWLGLVTAYIAALAGALVAYRNLPPWLQNAPAWQRVLLLAAFPVLAFVFQAVPAAYDRWRKNVENVTFGPVAAGYFRLDPRDDEATFTRADGLHDQVLKWLSSRTESVLFLTGMSGSGKSSLLNAWVLPKLHRQGTTVVRLRGYQELAAAMVEELRKPGVIWQKEPQHSDGLRALIEKASRAVKPGRLLVVVDQFEEFVILQDKERREPFERLISAFRAEPVAGFSLLLVFRSDYIGLVEGTVFPPLLQGSTWKEIPPFKENAAREFMKNSGLEAGPELMRRRRD